MGLSRVRLGPRRPRRAGVLAAALLAALAAAAARPAAAAESPPAEVRLRAADVLARQGELRRAQGLLEAALAGVGEGAPAAERAPVLSRLGRVLGELGERDRAAEVLGRAADAAREAGLEGLRGEALNDLGNALLDDDPAAAIAAYEEGGTIAAGRGLGGLAARCAINAARAELRRDEPGAAAGRLATAGRALAGLPAEQSATLERLAAAGVAVEVARQDRGRVGEAYRAAAAAREAAARSGDPRDLSWADGYLGELYALEGRAEEALLLYRRAALRAEAAGAPEVLFRWQWFSGRALARLGRRDEAIAAYRSAARNLDLVRLDLPAFDPRTGRSLFRETLGPVFVELADLLLRRAETAPGDVGQVDLVEVRSTVERLKTVELEDYFRDDCAAGLGQGARPVDRPGTRTAVLYPVLLEDRTHLVASLPDGRLVSARAPLGAEAMGAAAARLRSDLAGPAEGRPLSQGFMEPARLLYDQLVRPVEPLLDEQRVETIVFVPDGALRLIPLSALHDGERFVAERWAVATGLGLSLLDTRPLPERRLSVLVGGLTQAVQGEQALPSVAQEVAALRRIVGPAATTLTDAAFTTAALEGSLDRAPFSVVHLASHAKFAGDPKDSFILTWDGRLDMDELERLVRRGQSRGEPVELLTLSACETAAGDDRSALGLAGVAVKVGARSAFASLWAIADESTAPLVAEFYRNLLLPGVNRAEALRRAQLTLLADGRYRHPFFWAPFLLIGNWL